MSEPVQIVFGLLGGLALFLFGMTMMSDNLLKIAGERMKKILGVLTANPVMGVLSGALVTAVLQSSSATTVMTIGFVSAGLMTLPQAISVIFGANIGTTITAQLIAFNLSDYVWIIIFAGFLFYFIGKGQQIKAVGGAILGFGLLFLGINTMGDVMKPLASSEAFADAIKQVSDVPILGMLVGCGMTLIAQSSSATIAVLQNVASQTGPDGIHSVIGLTGAIPVLLGDNIGTTITAILASLNLNRNAKRTAAAHCIFNLSGSLIFIWFVKPYAALITYLSPKGDEIDVISRQIANAHTGFNLIMTLVWTPLLWLMVKIVMKLLPEKEEEKMPVEKPVYLDDTVIGQPIAALPLAVKEIVRCSGMAREMLSAINSLSKKDPELQAGELAAVAGKSQKEKKLSGEINRYMERIFLTGTMSENLARQATGILFILNEIDRIADLCGEIADNISGSGPYSKEATKDLRRAAGRILAMYDEAMSAIIDGREIDPEKLHAEKLEIDQMDSIMREHHIQRVGKGRCRSSLTAPFNGLLHCISRIGNSCMNLSDMALEKVQFKTFLDL